MPLDLLQGRVERLPAEHVPFPQSEVVNSFGTRYLLERHAPTLVLDVDVACRVVHLLQVGRPTAVARFVVAVDVDSVERMLRRRTRPHVVVERCEVVEPAITDADAPASILVVAIVGGAIAAPLHARPRAVLRGMPRNRSVTVRPVPIANGPLGRSAPTTRGVATPKVGGCHSGGPAAVADAVPCNVLPARKIRRPRAHNQPPEPLPRQLKSFHANNLAELQARKQTGGCMASLKGLDVFPLVVEDYRG